LYDAAELLVRSLAFYRTRSREVLLRRRLALLLSAAMLLAMMVVLVAPAFAQGGCKDFGVQGVSDQARNTEEGMGGYASFFGQQGEMDGAIHTSQEEFCSGS
jgi:hypothetical protein